jgi:DNA-binding transcriptional ArsR family regulator
MLNYVAIDRIFKALGDPSRRLVVECLCDGEASVGWLALHLPVSLPAILKHLRVLERNGLIHTEKVGRQRVCRIEPRAIELIDLWVRPRRKIWDRNLQRLKLGG